MFSGSHQSSVALTARRSARKSRASRGAHSKLFANLPSTRPRASARLGRRSSVLSCALLATVSRERSHSRNRCSQQPDGLSPVAAWARASLACSPSLTLLASTPTAVRFALPPAIGSTAPRREDDADAECHEGPHGRPHEGPMVRLMAGERLRNRASSPRGMRPTPPHAPRVGPTACGSRAHGTPRHFHTPWATSLLAQVQLDGRPAVDVLLRDLRHRRRRSR